MISDRKNRMRRACLRRRDMLPPALRREMSAALATTDLPFLRDLAPGAVISGFLPIRSEIDPRPLLSRLASMNFRLALPRIIGNRLEFAAYSFGDPLFPGRFGTSEPGPDAASLDPALMLVPLAAFDLHGGRLGYGKGYYDAAIAACNARGKAPTTVGLAFSIQQVDAVPMEPHDRPLDWILTENGPLRTV